MSGKSDSSSSGNGSSGFQFKNLISPHKLKKAEQAALKQKKKNEMNRIKESIKKQYDCSERSQVWKDDILPYWNEESFKNSRIKDLCHKGIPSNVRETVWPILIGNKLLLDQDAYQSLRLKIELDQVTGMYDGQLETDETHKDHKDLQSECQKIRESLSFEDHNILQEVTRLTSVSASISPQHSLRARSDSYSYRYLSTSVARAPPPLPALDSTEDFEDGITSDDRHAMVSTILFPLLSQRPETISLIEFDLPRTFPTLKFFHDGGPLQLSLERILQCYAYFRPDIGYVQGMSYLAAMLLLNMEECQAFICLANLLDRRSTRDFYGLQRESINVQVKIFDYFFRQHLPLLYEHMNKEGVSSEMYLLDWHLSLFAKTLPIEVVARLWDIYLFEGEIFLLRTCLGLLKMHAVKLCYLQLEDIMSFLVHLPAQLDVEELIQNINQIQIVRRKYESLREKLQQEARNESEPYMADTQNQSFSEPGPIRLPVPSLRSQSFVPSSDSSDSKNRFGSRRLCVIS